MRVCYFGTYSTEPGYPRNRVLIKGLRKNGVEVIECHKPLWRDADEKERLIKNFPFNLKAVFRAIFTYFYLTVQFFKIKNCDLIIVGYTGHFDIFLARLLNIFRRKPLIFDAFLSLYDTAVMDRKIVSPGSFKAKFLWWVDRFACKTADAVILDTNEHIDYFAREFGLERTKFIRAFVGEDNTIFRFQGASAGAKERFNVLFFGTYIPLHGIEYILQAANILKEHSDISFKLVGIGPLLTKTLDTARSLGLKNTEFVTHLADYNELIKHIMDADICLGIFGNTDKAKRVIPCKIYDSMALGKPVITGDSPAVRELLTDGKDVMLCNMADPESLANAILEIKNNNELRENIGQNAFETFEAHASPEAIGRELLKSLSKLATDGH